MNASTFLLVLIGVLLNAAAQLLLKAGTNAFEVLGLSAERPLQSAIRVATEPHIAAGLACYVISVGVWIVALSRAPVSVAYPMLSIGYIVNALAAWWLFAEPLTAQKMLGIAVIAVGVALVSRS
jgi:multidrug transporter EmrE-like cation transporter